MLCPVMECPRCRARFRGDIERCPLDGERLSRVTLEQRWVGRRFGPYEVTDHVYVLDTGDELVAWDETLDRPVALWVCRRVRARDFVRELVDRTRAVRDPRVREVLGYGTSDGASFVAYERSSGVPLHVRLQSGPVPDWLCRKVFHEVALALRASHSVDVQHGALRPDNIYVSEVSHATIFGFADRPMLDQCSVIHDGFGIELMYGAPEQLRGEEKLASDVYRWGACLFEALTGRPLHQERHFDEALRRPVFELPEELRRSPFADLLVASLKTDPSSRPPFDDIVKTL